MSKYICIIIFALIATSVDADAKSRLRHESYYQEIACKKAGGISEYVLEDRTRVDCLTKDHAIEYDFANKWYEGVTQALWYAMLTNRKARLDLILERHSDKKHFRNAQKFVEYYKLKLSIRPIYNTEDQVEYYK